MTGWRDFLPAVVLGVCLCSSAVLGSSGEIPATGTVRGAITLSGPAPKPVQIEVDRNVEHCGRLKSSEDLLVDPSSGGISNAVIWLERGKPTEGTKAGNSLEPRPAHLENKNCRFEPHVQGTTVGSDLEISNVDPILHTTRARYEDRITLFNLPLPNEGLRVRRKLRKAGLVVINCEVHRWMKAFVWVFDHPRFAVTDEKGNYEISKVPPGRYTLRAWHEKLGELRLPVRVEEKARVTVNLQFEPNREKGGGHGPG